MSDPILQMRNAGGRVCKVDPKTEEVLGILLANTYQLWPGGGYYRALPHYIDDTERDFGLDIYDRMLHDPACAAAINSIKVGVLSEGPKFISPIHAPRAYKPNPEDEAKYAKSLEVRDVIEAMFDNLNSPLESIIGEMFQFLPFGHCIAEKVYAPENGLLALKKLTVKPRTAYAFCSDVYLNMPGFIAAKLGGLMMLTIPTNVEPNDIIPRDKFWVMTWNPYAGDPRGQSILRPAYNSWYIKQRVWGQYLKYLDQFATPSLKATLPPGAGDTEITNSDGSLRLDSEGNPQVLTAEEAMLQKLMAFSNGTAIVLPNGATLDPLQSTGDGSAYTAAIDLLDRQMTRAILITARGVMEAQHGSKADSSSAQDMQGDLVQYVQRLIEMTFYRDVIYPTVALNFGDEIAKSMCPVMTLSDLSREDVVAMANAVANLQSSGYLHPSQYQGIDAKLNLPERSE